MCFQKVYSTGLHIFGPKPPRKGQNQKGRKPRVNLNLPHNRMVCAYGSQEVMGSSPQGAVASFVKHNKRCSAYSHGLPLVKTTGALR